MELEAADLRRQAPVADFGFATTAEVTPASDHLGQARAQSALDFAMSMAFEGYNLYALGAPQIGMLEFVRERLGARAAAEATPDDVCYLNHFDDPSSPRMCLLPHGVGSRFRDDVAAFIRSTRETLPAALTSDEVRKQVADLTSGFQQKQMADAAELQKEAEGLGLTMLPTPNGFAFAPVGADGKAMDQEAFTALDEAEKKRIAEGIEHMSQRLVERLQEYPRHQEELVRRHRELRSQVAQRVLGGLTARLKARYQIHPEATAFVVAAEKHLLAHLDRLLALEFGQAEPAPAAAAPARAPSALLDQFFAQFQVNLLVDRSGLAGAPVVYESNPSLDNLVGKLEHRFEYGTPVVDFSMIRAGALHRANGGYLIVDVERLLQKPFAWEALKRALSDGCVRVESVTQLLNMAYSVSLDPDPIPLSVKVVLLGTREHYQLLRRYDTDFDNLFKILADFDDYVAWDAEGEAAYAGMLARLIADSRIRHLTAAAVASTLEHSSRLVEDRRRLSARVKDMADILREADQLAKSDGSELIEDRHIDRVILNRAYRVDRIKELVHENITRGVTLVETQGVRVGQINGLSVLQLGKLVFGQPSRITATARIGRGEVIDIEREARLGGNIHSKAVLIVANFLGARYARRQPLSLHASLVFEQSYGGIEGDSASIAEVCALISAIIERPLRQDLAITGSMDQHGTAQAIGGVNQKIEGFYDICNVQGMTGTQGVIVPRSNMDNLMLRQDVVDAVAAGRFHVYAMRTVDDAMSVLFAEPGGPPLDAAEINAAVAERVRELHRTWLSSSKDHHDGD